MQSERVRVSRINELTRRWVETKEREQIAQAQRLRIESEIYTLVEKDLPEKGTHTLDSGMKIVTGFTEVWDQDAVDQAYRDWPSDRPFPFRGEWKPDGKAVAYLRDNEPKLYARLSEALTLKPKKPSFSVKEV